MPGAALCERLAQFDEHGAHVLITQAPLFTDKAVLVPGSVFVVGHDTAARVLTAKVHPPPAMPWFKGPPACPCLPAGHTSACTPSHPVDPRAP